MLQILYQDAHMVAVVKPAGVLSEDSGEGSMPALLRQQDVYKRQYRGHPRHR